MLFAESEELALGAVVLRGAVADDAESVLAELPRLAASSPFRSIITPTGKPMSVEMTNCGAVGWVSDRRGYRYEERDPISGRVWPPMPEGFRQLAVRLARQAGYEYYEPDTCLINKYSVGSKMGMHQDRDERDFGHPIVSVSLGLSISFRFGGRTRTGESVTVELNHGDAVVFGGASRLAFHGVGKLRKGNHPQTGNLRYNLTFRVAL